MTAQAAPSSLVPVVALARDIKLSHSVFALPFALLATFLASFALNGRFPSALTIGLIIGCMVFARTVAMSFNRWADARIDAANPRTAGRAIPAGRLSPNFVLGAIGVCSLLFMLCAAGFYVWFENPWPLVLSPAVLLFICGYSYSKRFTWLCHLYVGAALAISPLAATIAVNPAYLRSAAPWCLFGMVMTWVGGFDIIYALQDVDIDRSAGLYSMPSRLGVETALSISRALHLFSFFFLLLLQHNAPLLRYGFLGGVLLTGGLLFLEHFLVWRSRTHHINAAFFTVNSIISLLLGTLGVIDLATGW